MKMAIRGAFTFIVIMLVVIIGSNSSRKGVIATETATISNNAAYIPIKMLSNGAYTVSNDEDLMGEVIKEIVLNKETNADIKVQVFSIDAENGLVDLNVIQTIKHANGQSTTTEERRTVILEN